MSLPQMVASSTMDPESVALVRDYVNELMVYVFFLSSICEIRAHSRLQVDGDRTRPYIHRGIRISQCGLPKHLPFLSSCAIYSSLLY